MPFSFIPVAGLGRRRTGTPRRRPLRLRPYLGAAGWIGAVVSIFSVFLGGAGGVMLLAGHRDAASVGLAALGTVSVGYLIWFFNAGPGRDPAGRANHHHRAPVPAHEELHPVCWFCGNTEGREHGVPGAPSRAGRAR